jgi:hypothetical protein
MGKWNHRQFCLYFGALIHILVNKVFQILAGDKDEDVRVNLARNLKFLWRARESGRDQSYSKQPSLHLMPGADG